MCRPLNNILSLRSPAAHVARAVLFALPFVVAACASIPQLRATYQLPPSSSVLKGESLALTVEDRRPTEGIIAQGAAEEFRNFPGTLTLLLSRPDGQMVKLGLYDPPSLVRETFQKRLRDLGVGLAPEGSDAIHLMIFLEEFRLDLIDRNWVASMRYEARLEKEGRMLAGQSITGRAERLRVFGRKGADEVMSEVVTDTVNRLEIGRLFRQARQMDR